MRKREDILSTVVRPGKFLAPVGISVLLKLHDKILRSFRLGQSCPRLQFRTTVSCKICRPSSLFSVEFPTQFSVFLILLFTV